MPEPPWWTAAGPGARLCRLDYVSAALDAERRLRRGERQAYCPTCKRWYWPDEGCGHADRVGEAEFARLAPKES